MGAGFWPWGRRSRSVELPGRLLPSTIAPLPDHLAPRFLRMEGMRIRYLDVGSGPAVILLHGMGHDLLGWRYNIMPLVRAGFRAIALDLPGFGMSDAPASVEPEAYQQFVLSWMDMHCLPAASLVGNSMGGALAANIASAAPDRVSHLLLVSPAGFGRELAWWFRLLGVDFLAPILPRVSRLGVRQFLGQVYADRKLIDETEVERLYQEAQRPEVSDTLRRMGKMTLGVGGVRPDYLIADEAASQIRATTLVVWGTKDRILPVKHSGRAAALIPDAELELLPGIGHCPQMEAAEQFNQRLIAHLARPGFAARTREREKSGAA